MAHPYFPLQKTVTAKKKNTPQGEWEVILKETPNTKTEVGGVWKE